MVTIPSNRTDPTGTKTLRERYAAKLRGQFADLNTLIRKRVVEEDGFGLRSEALAPRFEFSSDPEAAFLRWLAQKEQEGVLETIERGDNTYIRSAYSRGLKDADKALADSGIQVPEQTLQNAFNQGVHSNAVRRLYESNYMDLEDISREMNRQISDELSEGFARGENPRKIGRRITDRVDKIGKTRATTLAQTRVIDAYSESTLNRYEQMGVGSVTIKAEWLTAGDDRVCPICNTLEGNTWTLQEARTATFQFEPGADDPDHLAGEFPVRPPAHPNCRCRIIPEVS